MDKALCDSRLQSSGASDMTACLMCAVYLTLTAFGSFFTGALCSAAARAIKERYSLHGEKIRSNSTPQPTVRPLQPNKPIGPPPRRRHSISVSAPGEQNSIAILAARRNKAIRGTSSFKDAALTAELDRPSSSPADSKPQDDEERDVVGPLARSSSTPRGFMAIRQKGRSITASLRKMSILDDNPLEQVCEQPLQ
jgi:hypothetical protein